MAVSHDTDIPSLVANSHLESARERWGRLGQALHSEHKNRFDTTAVGRCRPGGDGVVSSVLQFLLIGPCEFIFSFCLKEGGKRRCFALEVFIFIRALDLPICKR